MAKYILKRVLFGIFSIVVVVGIVMIMIYSILDRNLIFAQDTNYSKTSNNRRTTYSMEQWEKYGYLDYVTYSDYLTALRNDGEIDEDTRATAVKLGYTAESDSDLTAQYTALFTEYYESQGYTVVRLDAVMAGKRLADGGTAALYAYKDIPVTTRLLEYFLNMFHVDNIHYVEENYPDADIGEIGLTFTLYDPVYGGEKFSPAIMGNGTEYKYLLYFTDSFPYIHQNLFTINLGLSYTVNRDEEITITMTKSQGSYVYSTVLYPTGLIEESANDLHSARYSYQSVTGESSLALYTDRFTDDYSNVQTVKSGLSRMGYSFIIGIIATILAYALGLPLGVLMARRKEKFADKLGTFYIVFISAVPSLAYIFMFKSIGGSILGRTYTTFTTEVIDWRYYVLPVVSLMLPSVASLMKWLRRYMIDQMNSDYVKFARSGGLSESEIFSKHILKNAVIPIVHGIPGSILGAMTGAFITERIYTVPGVGGLLITAIQKYDNGVIVGVTVFYAALSVVSIIMGDVLMSMVDPRISFTEKAR